MELRTARQIARLTQHQLAAAAEVDHTTIAKLELEPMRYLTARYQTIINIARVLGVTPDQIFPVPPLQQPAARPA